jgi:hypothetical protein
VRRGALLVLVLALAGCGSGKAPISKGSLPELVLHDRDVPAFAEFANGPQTRADLHPGPRDDPARFGRLGGWIARYRRPGIVSARHIKGPLVIESRADVFPSSGAAKKDLGAYEAEYEAAPVDFHTERISPPRIGDDTVAFRFGSGLDHFVLVAWRKANATASVLVEGPSVALPDAVRLAKLQQVRIAAAA